ncbi:MAG: quinolinate synthase NadA, partial [Zetaproteobacteria bacterium]
CSTMFRTDPQHLCASLEAVRAGQGYNQILVPEHQKRWARIALNRMLALA